MGSCCSNKSNTNTSSSDDVVIDVPSSTNDTGKTCKASRELEKYLENELPSKSNTAEHETIKDTEAVTDTFEGGKDKLLNDITMEVINENDDNEDEEITVFKLIEIENGKLDQMIQNEKNDQIISDEEAEIIYDGIDES